MDIVALIVVTGVLAWLSHLTIKSGKQYMKLNPEKDSEVRLSDLRQTEENINVQLDALKLEVDRLCAELASTNASLDALLTGIGQRQHSTNT